MNNPCKVALSTHNSRVFFFKKNFDPLTKMKIMIEELKGKPEFEDIFYCGLYICDELCELTTAQLAHVTGFSVNPLTDSLVLIGDIHPYDFPVETEKARQIRKETMKRGLPLC